MKLRALSAHFFRVTKSDENGWRQGTWNRVTLAKAHGVWYLCPKCFLANGGPIGTHAVLNFFRGRVPDNWEPGPGRWTPSGTGLDDLTFVPGDPPIAISVLLTAGCAWHGFVKNGEAA